MEKIREGITLEENFKKKEPPKISFSSIPNLKNETFNKSNNFLNKYYRELEIQQIKIINSLLYIFDTYNNIHKKNENIKEHFRNIVFNNGCFSIRMKDLLNIMNDKRNITKNDLDSYLESIRVIPLKYYIYQDLNGKKVKREVRTSFLSKYEIITPLEDNGEEIFNETYINLYLDRDSYIDIFLLRKSVYGYTNLSINLNKISSKLGLGLYEELKRILPIKNIDNKGNTNGYKNDFEYTLKELNDIFNTNYKYLSKIKPKIEIQYKKLLEMKLLKDIYSFNYSKKHLEIKINRSRQMLEEVIF